jgi:hypothetical protein
VRKGHERLTRRELLRIGGLGLAGLGLADLLRRESLGAASSTRARSVILIQHYGGPSHIDLWDPKPDAPAEIRGQFQTIPTSLPGYRVTEIMPRIARLCHKLTLIRSMNHSLGFGHNPATYLALTGHTPEVVIDQASASPTDWPPYGAVLARQQPAGSKVPPFVQIPHIAFDIVAKSPGQWAGLLGRQYDPLIVVGDPNDPDYRFDALSLPADISSERLEDRHALLRRLDLQLRRNEASLAQGSLDAFRERAFAILSAPETGRAFNLAAERDTVRDRYGRNKVGQSYLLARRLVEAGVRFVTCFNGSDPDHGWDTHTDNFGYLRNLMPPDDQAFSALVEDLEARGLLATTLVIWAGEFGRKPQIGQRGQSFATPTGRDHWPACYTIALAGGGVKQGLLYGASDRIAAYPADNPTSPADFAATLYWALGIDPKSEIRDHRGRLQPLTTGTPMPELFA